MTRSCVKQLNIEKNDYFFVIKNLCLPSIIMIFLHVYAKCPLGIKWFFAD